jgi:hypothetical protein
MSKLLDFLRRLRSISPDELEEGGRRGAANVDAMAAAIREPGDGEGDWPGAVPPNYIKTYDEGRRKK